MTGTDAPAPRRRSIVPLAIFALAGVAVLLSLGTWQVERLAWKNDLVARMEARLAAPAVALPPSSEWPRLVASDYEYTRVSARGVFEHEAEALIYRTSGKVAGAMVQPGYWVMTPLRLADGARILVNRGFIGLDSKDRASRAAGRGEGEVSITGLLRAPEPRGTFTPPDNPGKAEWFTRDPLAIAAALRLERAAPFSIDEVAHAAPPGEPAGGATIVDIPNNHLSYALTWFGLAATLLGVFVAFVWRRRA